MLVRDEYPRPRPWAEHRATIRHSWTIPLQKFDWMLRWLAHYLSRWALLEVLEYLGTFSVLIAVIFYFSEAGDRKKQKHYQAWQVINTAQGKGGSGEESRRYKNSMRIGCHWSASTLPAHLSGAFACPRPTCCDACSKQRTCATASCRGQHGIRQFEIRQPPS